MSDNTNIIENNDAIFEKLSSDTIIKNISKINTNDTVYTWITKVNNIINVLKVVVNSTDAPANLGVLSPEYYCGFMSSTDKNFLDFLYSNITKSETSGIIQYAELIDTITLKCEILKKKINTVLIKKAADNKPLAINHDSLDVTRIDISTSGIAFVVDINPGTNTTSELYYSEKIIGITSSASSTTVQFRNTSEYIMLTKLDANPFTIDKNYTGLFKITLFSHLIIVELLANFMTITEDS